MLHTNPSASCRQVYNLTHYLRFHPGGVPLLLKVAGRDGTALFNKYHAWVRACGVRGRLVDAGRRRGGGAALFDKYRAWVRRWVGARPAACSDGREAGRRHPAGHSERRAWGRSWTDAGWRAARVLG